MMAKKYRVTLTSEERVSLEQLIGRGKAAARKLAHARILLRADEGGEGPGWTDGQIAEGLEVGLATVARVRQRFVDEGLAAALVPRPSTRIYARKLDGEGEAHLIALACATPPEGRKRWTLRLLADRMVALGRAERLSYETVRRVLKKNELKPWLRRMWCIPPEADCEFVAAMEDVLEVYTRPADPKRPLVCLDEASKQPVGGLRAPLPPRPGQPPRYDCEYVRRGVANLFIAFEPLNGWRRVRVTDTRRRCDWAWFMKELVDERYPDAERVVLVMDRLNTHSVASLYAAFPPEEAGRLARRLEIHHTPKHGSWLNMAEIELGVLARQCLDERMEDKVTLARQVAAWERDRNEQRCRVDWRFTTADARIKLKRLYPSTHV